MSAPTYTMRALANPGPGYVTWQYAYPDYLGTYAPSPILAGTAVIVSDPVPVKKRLPLASDHALAVFCDEAAAPWADSGAMSSGNFTVANGTPNANQPGIISKSIGFQRNGGNADEAIVGPNNPTLSSGVTAITLMGWIFPTDSPTSLGILISKQRNAVYSVSGQVIWLGLLAARTPSFGGINLTTVSSGIIATLSAWHHLAGTYDGATLNVYLDGVLVGTQADASGLDWGGAVEQAYPWWIGNSQEPNNANRRGFVGYIEDVRVITRALPISEIEDVVARGRIACGVYP